MDLPNKPPLDDQKNLSMFDVEGCIWFVWQRTLKDMNAYPDPLSLMKAKIKDSFPQKPWGVEPDPDGVAKKFFKDIQSVLDGYTRYRSNLGFTAFTEAYDGGKTWAEFAAQVLSEAVYVAGLQRAEALKSIP